MLYPLYFVSCLEKRLWFASYCEAYRQHAIWPVWVGVPYPFALDF